MLGQARRHARVRNAVVPQQGHCHSGMGARAGAPRHPDRAGAGVRTTVPIVGQDGRVPRHRLPAWLAVGGAVMVGVLTATQARINGSLGLAFGDGLVAALVSFGSGLVVLAVLAIVLPDGRAGLPTVAGCRRGSEPGGPGRRSIPLWMLLGGVAGALTVATQGLTVATIGVALFTVGVVAGQTVNGLVLDRVGYGPAGVVAVTMGRVTGAALVLLAVVLCVAGEGLASVPWWMLLLPFLAGAGIAWQQATNGRLRQAVESPLIATLVNFVVGAVVLGVGDRRARHRRRVASPCADRSLAVSRRSDRGRLHLPVGGARAAHRRAAARPRLGRGAARDVGRAGRGVAAAVGPVAGRSARSRVRRLRWRGGRGHPVAAAPRRRLRPDTRQGRAVG